MKKSELKEQIEWMEKDLHRKTAEIANYREWKANLERNEKGNPAGRGVIEDYAIAWMTAAENLAKSIEQKVTLKGKGSRKVKAALKDLHQVREKYCWSIGTLKSRFEKAFNEALVPRKREKKL